MKETGAQAHRFPIFPDGHRLSGVDNPASTLPQTISLFQIFRASTSDLPRQIGRKDARKPPASEIRSTRLKPSLRPAADVVQGHRAADDQFGEALVLHSQAIVDVGDDLFQHSSATPSGPSRCTLRIMRRPWIAAWC